MRAVLREVLGNRWVQAVFLTAVGVGLVMWVFAGQDLGAVWAKMRSTEWKFLFLAILLSGLGHGLRAIRWRDLFDSSGGSPRISSAFLGLMIGYLVNFAIPRLGELTRSAVLLRLDAVPLLRSIGTVIVERSLDVLILFLLMASSTLLIGGKIQQMVDEWMIEPMREWLETHPMFLLMALLMLLLLMVFWIAFRRKLVGRINTFQASSAWLREILAGLKGVLRVQQPFKFLLTTCGIWLTYWSGPACTMAAMGMWREDSLTVSFAMFTMGSLARTIPLPAGSMGPYHFIVSQVLMAFGYDATTALAAATVNHATQTAFYFISGGMSALVLPWMKSKVNQASGNENELSLNQRLK